MTKEEFKLLINPSNSAMRSLKSCYLKNKLQYEIEEQFKKNEEYKKVNFSIN
jgi:hypothetical protein